MMQLVPRTTCSADAAWAWGLIGALGERARAGEAIEGSVGVNWESDRLLVEAPNDKTQLLLQPGLEPCFQSATRLAPDVQQLFELYLPLCLGRAANTLVIGHLGQSLDGQIATASGASRYVTGPENILHLHRLRSLAHAVVVGAGTVELDDPELTTRLVPGPHATRVIIDPTRRLPTTRKVFQDGLAPTLVVCARGAARARATRVPVLEVSVHQHGLSIAELLLELAARGLRRVFIEGGGVTISHFIEARRLDRLHVTICPIIVGRGRPGISVPGVERLDQALRPSARRFLLGEDVLFDCRMPR